MNWCNEMQSRNPKARESKIIKNESMFMGVIRDKGYRKGHDQSDLMCCVSSCSFFENVVLNVCKFSQDLKLLDQG